MKNFKQKHFTFTIVGAGASGLWLAYEFLKQGLLNNNTLCIVEFDVNKVNDRTWCFWDINTTIPDKIISKNWANIYNQHRLTKNECLAPYKYYHIRSADFYDYIKKHLANNKNVFWKNNYVTQINTINNQVEVITNLDSWNSNFVFTSIMPIKNNIQSKSLILNPNNYPQKISTKKPDLFLWQSFVGWRVQTNNNVFDENRISMMQFTNISQDGNTQFMYELPFDKNNALVEITRFGKEKLSKIEAKIELEKFMLNKNCTYSIIEEEIGAIPMTTAYDVTKKYLPKNQHIIYIGTAAGAIKPTTGYGFKRMKAYSISLSNAIKYNTKIPTMHRLWRFRLYDTLLLKILKNEPEKGKQIFETLFKTQPIQRILKFLDEDTSIWEEIKIFIKLPIHLFLKYLMKHIVLK